MPLARSSALLVAAVLAVASCGSDEAGTDGAHTITVFAAASLTEAFTDVAEAFEADHPDTSVTLNFAGSSELATQILQGAPADVFVSADSATMATLTDADATEGDPTIVATNRSEIIVEAGNPLGITGLEDLASPDLVVVTCAPEVPCGAYAMQILDRAGVTVEADSLESNVKGVVTKVVLGEADAGIVYATDVIAAGDGADGVEIPDAINVLAEYPIAATAESGDPATAQAFIDFATGDEGERILATYGFSAP